VKKNILCLFSQIDVTNYHPLSVDYSGEYFVGMANWKKQKVVVKVGRKETHLKRFLKEIEINGYIIQGNSLSKKNFLTTNVLDFGQNDEYCWVIRQFYKGTPFGKIPKIGDPFFSHPVSRKFEINRTKICSMIVENVMSLQSFSNNDKTSHFQKRINNFIVNHENRIENITQVNLSPMNILYDNIGDEYLSEKWTKASICDLTPANIIVSEGQQDLVFLDLEWLSLDNSTIDFAYLWLFLWKFPLWQRELVINYQAVEGFRDDFFRISIARIILYWYTRLLMIKENKQEKLAILKNHVWTRYLRATGESFEALMKVK